MMLGDIFSLHFPLCCDLNPILWSCKHRYVDDAVSLWLVSDGFFFDHELGYASGLKINFSLTFQC